MKSFDPTPICNLCGSAVVRSDEVVLRERLLLHECVRCRHRWTGSPQAPIVARPSLATRSFEPAEVALAS